MTGTRTTSVCVRNGSCPVGRADRETPATINAVSAATHLPWLSQSRRRRCVIAVVLPGGLLLVSTLCETLANRKLAVDSVSNRIARKNAVKTSIGAPCGRPIECINVERDEVSRDNEDNPLNGGCAGAH